MRTGPKGSPHDLAQGSTKKQQPQQGKVVAYFSHVRLERNENADDTAVGEAVAREPPRGVPRALTEHALRPRSFAARNLTSA